MYTTERDYRSMHPTQVPRDHSPWLRRSAAIVLLVVALAGCAQPAATPAPTDALRVATMAPTNTALPPTATPTPAAPTPTRTLPPPTDVPTWPKARVFPGLVCDANSERMVLFGGVDKGIRSPNAYATDMWSLDALATRWTLLEEACPVRWMNGAEAYDAESDRIVVQDWFSSRTMALDADLEKWERKDRFLMDIANGAAMAYDSESDRMILFGGVYTTLASLSDETWAYDYNTDTWTQMAPEIRPPARYIPVMVYDEGTDRVVMWGGWQRERYSPPEPATYDRQVWAYDYDHDAWTSLGDTGGPEVALVAAQAVHHPSTGRMILFGGQYADPDGLSDKTWAYSYRDKAWTELLPDQSPSARTMHSMAYDSAADKITLFGGETVEWGWMVEAIPTDYSDELWLFDPNTDQWSQVTPGG